LRATPEAKIIALGVEDDEDIVLACAEAGVSGFVPPEGTLDDLLATVESVRRGEILCSPRTAGVLLRRVASLAGNRDSAWIELRLTRRELQIVQLIDEGCSNKEIARLLTISLATVKNHVHNILEKLDVTRRSEAAACVRGAKHRRSWTSRSDRGLHPLNPRI
jgi:DNA-binding NarL/FixJ family response regulator